MKRTASIIAALLLCVAAMAQGFSGGIKASVVNRQGRAPIAGATVELYQGGELIATKVADAEGRFLFENVPNGSYSISVSADGFMDSQINVIVEKGLMRDLMFVTLSPGSMLTDDVDASNFSEFDMDDSGYTDNPTILFTSNDPYNKIVSFGFSAIRFKNRGYNSETQDVFLSGVNLNDAITGYSPYSLWTGLNEVMRAKDTSNGLDVSDYGIGGYNGTTNIFANPSNVRPGLRASILSNSALYRLRLMLTYASGTKDNGWSYAFSASARLGGNDWVKGVYYRSFAYYAGAEKKINDEHKIAFFTFATPGERGAQNASTQEVYNLMGDNMYNSNWGYQNGKVRNTRVRKTFEPVTVVKYTYTPGVDFESNTTFLWRTGRNGYTALDWYDALDPRPDYYRNLPSYAWMADEDYNRVNADKADWLNETWTGRTADYLNYQHVNWDRLYQVNYNSEGGRSHYAQEQRHVDQNDINLAETVKWRFAEWGVLNAGASYKWNRTENYKKIADLLGGKYFLNVDSFAERDYAVNESKIQNDLDFYLKNGRAEEIKKGQKYGYDYLANIRRAELWANGSFEFGGLSGNIAGSVGRESFWREGLVRKGLFAGLDDNGNVIRDPRTGIVLTSYDANGKVITSKGKSDVCSFITWSAKAGLAYMIGASHRLSANVGYFNDAPTFNEAFISPRTRNTIMDGLKTKKIFSTDVNYQFSTQGYNIRLTGFYTTIKDQSDMMSFYDDTQHSFTNFAMTGIDQRHAGIELGAKVPLPVTGLSLSGVLSWGEYIYTSTPHMVQTMDNSASIIRDADVTYWQHTPVYRKITLANGTVAYDQDLQGNYIIESYKKHYVPSTPQVASEIALNYNKNYWFLELNTQYFARSFLDMNPLYRTTYATAGGDGVETPVEVEYMTEQEEFRVAFVVNASVGKSWFVRGRQVGFSLQVNNMLNNRRALTGGYEQTRLISNADKNRYYRFDSKYFYMPGVNYMLNVYFRF